MFSGVMGEIFIALRKNRILISVFAGDRRYEIIFMGGIRSIVTELVIVHDKIIVFRYI